MSTTITSKAIQTAQGALGILHFVAQSTADLLMEAEATLVHKSIGTDKEEVRTSRLAITMARQEKVINQFNKSRAFAARAEQNMLAEQE